MTAPSERQVRAFETRLLGAEHAAEHAAQRQLTRTGRRPVARVARRLAVATPPDEVGAWDPVATPLRRQGGTTGIIGINAALLPTGKVLWYSYPRIPAGQPTDPNEAWAVLWDPVSRTFKDVPPPINPATGKPWNIFCSALSLMADGRVLVTGGVLEIWKNQADPARGDAWKGLDRTFTFDPYTERWQEHERMRHGRYYPSQVMLPDGRTFIMQGTDETGSDADNLDLELFDPAKPLGQEVEWLGTLPTWAHGDYYPHLFSMPSGRALVAGPYVEDSWALQSGGDGGDALGLGFRAIDIPNPALNRTWGTGVLLPLEHDAARGEVVQYGGANDRQAYPHRAVSSAEGYREGAAAWSAHPPLNVGRAHHNTVLLPDGSMVTVGGGVGDADPGNKRTFVPEHKQVELWDPATRQWRLGPSQLEARTYHSTALLLPDGSVVSAGDDVNGGTDRDSYEIYKPPYFFKGERPVITSAPPVLGYAGSATVRTPDADIARAVLMAPGAPTHAIDPSQRSIRLPVTRRADGTGYDLRTPVSANVAPPGHYMLFLVDTAGRPSVAAWVRLDGGATSGPPLDPSSPAPTPSPAPPPTGGPAAPRDTIAPHARASLTPARLKVVRRRGRLALRVRVDEAAQETLDVRLTRAPSRRAGRPATVARWHRSLRVSRAAERTITLRLTRAQRSRLRGDVRVEAAIVVRDAAGNVRRAALRRRLR